MYYYLTRTAELTVLLDTFDKEHDVKKLSAHVNARADLKRLALCSASVWEGLTKLETFLSHKKADFRPNKKKCVEKQDDQFTLQPAFLTKLLTAPLYLPRWGDRSKLEVIKIALTAVEQSDGGVTWQTLTNAAQKLKEVESVWQTYCLSELKSGVKTFNVDFPVKYPHLYHSYDFTQASHLLPEYGGSHYIEAHLLRLND